MTRRYRFGYGVINHPNAQADWYNKGLSAYLQGNNDEAIADFDQSLAAYRQEQESSGVHRFLYVCCSLFGRVTMLS